MTAREPNIGQNRSIIFAPYVIEYFLKHLVSREDGVGILQPHRGDSHASDRATFKLKRNSSQRRGRRTVGIIPSPEILPGTQNRDHSCP
jgi:hypothetical protein